MSEKSILDRIHNALDEVRCNDFKPEFIVMNEPTYNELTKYLTQYYKDGMPNTIFQISIVLVKDLPFDMRVLACARHESFYDVRK